jgi:maltooligosyltrehalose trehalohydrolase
MNAWLIGGFRYTKDDLPQQIGENAIKPTQTNDVLGKRNRGCGSVLPAIPDKGHGSPRNLIDLVEATLALEHTVFLDVVANHFGPFHTDGLHGDAVHAIPDQGWVQNMAAVVHNQVDLRRCVGFVLKHHNAISHLSDTINVRWNNDGLNVLQALVERPAGIYYLGCKHERAVSPVRVLLDDSVYPADWSACLGATPKEPSLDLPRLSHVLVLQDPNGNWKFGEQLTMLALAEVPEAATADVEQRNKLPTPAVLQTCGAAVPRSKAQDGIAFGLRPISLRQNEFVRKLRGTALGVDAIGPRP